LLLDSQMAAFLAAFKLPDNYREQILASCRGTDNSAGVDAEILSKKARLSRIKDLYAWGDLDKAHYVAERQALHADLARLTASQGESFNLDRIAAFLQDLSLAWQAGNQEQRNRLAAELFEAVWVKDDWSSPSRPEQR
jgi:hypothetical protein